jgi:hypothetical protein
VGCHGLIEVEVLARGLDHAGLELHHVHVDTGARIGHVLGPGEGATAHHEDVPCLGAHVKAGVKALDVGKDGLHAPGVLVAGSLVDATHL